MTTYPAITLTELKTYLQIPLDNTQKDPLLNMLIESCTQAAETFLGRFVIARDILEEPHDCDDTKSKYLQLEHYPVLEITEITQNGVEIPLNAIKADKHNGILKKDTIWRGAALVSYRAGLSPDIENVPKNIRLALWQWIADILNQQEAGGIKSETLGDYSVSFYDERQLPPGVAMLLEPYRKVSL